MRYVPYLYFLRIPLIFALILPILSLVGLWIGGEPNPMLGGFFDLSYPGVFVVCLGVFLYGAALSVAATLVLLYGRERFFAAPLSAADLTPKHLCPPLSWHLKPAQIDDIQAIWKAYQQDNQAISRVISFLQNPQNSTP